MQDRVEWVVVDTTYLCHRAFHARRHEEADVSVFSGVVYDILLLEEMYHPIGWVFCFDVGKPIRKDVYPEYKEGRNNSLDEDEKAARKLLRVEMKRLAKETLPGFGFKNIHYAKGYEADDLVASACDRLSAQKKQCAVVGADKDLFQLLGKYVLMYNISKKQEYTADNFREEWGLEPLAWADVKAIAGCSSDNIQGIERVGEKTAAKFLCGTLPSHHKTYENIISGTTKIRERNMKLVKLPYQGTPEKEMVEGTLTREQWYSMKKMLGLDTAKEAIHLRRRKKREAE